MADYRKAREHMVESQVRTSSVSDWRILAQMKAVPRETFVAPARREVAYVDDIQWLGRRFMAPPALLGKLLQLCAITPTDNVLIVGAGTGYSTALVAGLAATATGLESDPELVAAAQIALAGVPNATVEHADFDHLPTGPFDAILVEGALASLPHGYADELKEGGRIVVPLLRSGVPVAHVIDKVRNELVSRAEFKAALPLLVPQRADDVFVF